MAKGQFEKGHTKATGRPKGVANKVTTSIRDKFQQLLDGYSIEQMVKDLLFDAVRHKKLTCCFTNVKNIDIRSKFAMREQQSTCLTNGLQS